MITRAGLTLDGLKIILVDEFDRKVFEHRTKDMRICKICQKAFEVFLIKDAYCSRDCFLKGIKTIKCKPYKPNVRFNPYVKTYFIPKVKQEKK